MRKWLYWGALAAVVMLPTSCIREKNFETYAPEPDAISFVISSYTTRSESVAKLEDEVRVNRYSLGTDDHGNLFTLEETVTRMDDWGEAPATRGTPAYSENVQDVHGSSFRGYLYDYSIGTHLGDGTFKAMEDGVRWRCELGFDPWKQSDQVAFLLSMPTEAAGLSNVAYNKNNHAFSFDYQTPTTAEGQQDLLFATRALEEAQYLNEQRTNGGAALLFRHALTGIKFNIGNNNTTAESRDPENQVETFITKVEFKGLAGDGTAVFVPSGVEDTEDDQTEFSSKDSFNWTLGDLSTDYVFAQTYSDEDIQDFDGDDAADAVHAPASFYAAGQNRNLNKADASLTFWFIPQVVTDALKLRVTFYVWDGVSRGEEMTKELDLGARILAQSSERQTNWVWKAGELRTFRLTPTAVDVEITAEIDEADDTKLAAPDVRNTGNSDAYIRVAIVGNWVDGSGNICLGSVGEDNNGNRTYSEVSAWSETNTAFGSFSGLGANGAWVKKSDGYWYYTHKVPAGLRPGESTPSDGNYVPLFQYYKKNVPPISSGSVSVPDGLSLMLDLAVQAVDAKAAGENVNDDYEAAWTAVHVL